MLLSGDYDGSIVAILEDLRETAELEGLAVLDLAETDLPVPYTIGDQGADTVAVGRNLLIANAARIGQGADLHQRPVLACPIILPPSRPGGLLLWRGPGATPWLDTDHSLAAAVAMLVSMTLSASIGQIGIDRLTGIPNRRWFLDEADRHIDRLDVDQSNGTLCLIDIDDMRRLNRTLGRAYGDRVLIGMASLLRATVRPGDVVARIGGDAFAVWQTGMDHLTAAERAESLCTRLLFDDLPNGYLVTFSIGIASRRWGSGEDVRTLLSRADMAAHEVRMLGGGGWRVSRPVPTPRG